MATQPVWSKDSDTNRDLQALNVAYCAGRDVHAVPPADAALAPHDLATNAAHALMLQEQGILSPAEGKAILEALLHLRNETHSLLNRELEDIHMSIEVRVTEMAGAGSGGRLHTGRSRNDQVATDMRLWLRDEIALVVESLHSLSSVLAKHALEHIETAVPGMTHMQPAMITTWGHWTTGYLARIVRDIRHLASVLFECRECPLGAAASFGSSWPTNRESTARRLGFDAPTANSADSINTRGELEARFVFAAAQAMNHLSGIGQDLILLSTPPRQWLRLANEFTTGSSIMPQKRNPDFAEVTRAKAAALSGHVQTLLGIGTAAPGGYNRDTQWTKYVAMDAASELSLAPGVFAGVFETLTVYPERMLQAAQIGFLNATDVADFLARTRDLPFRDCYRVLGQSTAACETSGKLDKKTVNAKLAEVAPDALPLTDDEMRSLEDPVSLLKQRAQTGAPNPRKLPESIEYLTAEANEAAESVYNRADAWRTAIKSLWIEVETTAQRSS